MTLDDVQKKAWQLFVPDLPWGANLAICKQWLRLKSEGTYIGVPITPEQILGEKDGQPRRAVAFTSGVVLTWYGGDDVRSS